METCNYLLYLALILMCTKFLGLLTRRARMPQVVGALLAGLLLGPAVFKIKALFQSQHRREAQDRSKLQRFCLKV